MKKQRERGGEGGQNKPQQERGEGKRGWVCGEMGPCKTCPPNPILLPLPHCLLGVCWWRQPPGLREASGGSPGRGRVLDHSARRQQQAESPGVRLPCQARPQHRDPRLSFLLRSKAPPLYACGQDLVGQPTAGPRSATTVCVSGQVVLVSEERPH